MRGRILFLFLVVFFAVSCSSSFSGEAKNSLLALDSNHVIHTVSVPTINEQRQQLIATNHVLDFVAEQIPAIRKKINRTICPVVGDADVGVACGIGVASVEVTFHCKEK